LKNYNEFLAEGKGPKPAGTIMRTDNAQKVKVAINFADETLETLRRKFIDQFYADVDDEEKKEIINKCVSTFVYCLDKKLRIDADIMNLLAKTVGMDPEELNKKMQEETEKFYGKSTNHYGMT
jgi:hypothetical protein